MYECPNCSGNLKFHIGKQALYCDHCDTEIDPYAFHKEQDAEEKEYYDVTVFKCPQCGGEILADDTTAATFCSYCGGSTILDSRISREKKPKYIIPFTKTREDCRKSYAQYVRHAHFAPKELKDKDAIANFRGIYMPYWIYSYEKKGNINFMGNQTRQLGEYQVIEYYTFNCEVDARYENLVFDASASFADNLSNAIAPFDLNGKKPFSPAFLSGFYADTNDVGEEQYYGKTKELIMEDVYSALSDDEVYSSYDFRSAMNRPSLFQAMEPRKIKAELAMFPVWFLTYRKKDRVAYAVINGQTGKAVADLPIDTGRFFKRSLLLSIPVILLLNLLFHSAPFVSFAIAVLLTSVCALIANHVTTEFLLKESCDVKGQEAEQERIAKENSKNLKDAASSAMLILPYVLGILLSSFTLLFVYLLWHWCYLDTTRQSHRRRRQ